MTESSCLFIIWLSGYLVVYLLFEYLGSYYICVTENKDLESYCIYTCNFV